MPHLLATVNATSLPLAGWLLLAGAALLTALVYAAACAIAPYRPCRACSGTGQRRSWLGYTRPCPRCDGHGQRLRWGRRVCNHLRRIHHRGTRPPTKRGSSR